MAALFDVITYQNRKYVELGSNTAAKDLIRKKVTLLQTLEPLMLVYLEGLVDIQASGAISITGYSDELRKQILEHLQ